MTGPHHFKLGMNGVTVRKAPLETQIEAAAAAGFTGFGLWMESVEAHLARGGSLTAPRELLERHGLEVTEACFLPEWQNLRGDALTEFLRRAEEFMVRAARLKLRL